MSELNATQSNILKSIIEADNDWNEDDDCTPLGMEDMGDVRRLFAKWANLLRKIDAQS